MRRTVFVLFLWGCLVAASDQDKCGDPPLVENAIAQVHEDNEYNVGATLEYNCEFGYIPSNYRRMVICIYRNDSDSVEWTTPTFTCDPKPCGDPGFVSHARRTGSVFTFSNKVIYTCDDGYKLVGSPQRFCQTNGQWSGSLPSCKSISCNIPEDPLNGHAVYDSLEYGAEVQYKCDKGFMLKNSGKSICSNGGVWSGEKPRCTEGHCELPSSPLHGAMNLIGGKTNTGSIVIFTCSDGYTLVGSQTTKCLNTGEWTFPTPQCLPPCKIPNVENGIIGVYKRVSRRNQFQEIRAGTVIANDMNLSLKCSNRKFQVADSALQEVSLSCSNSKWTREPICIPAICRSDPPEVPNARLTTSDNKHGTALVYQCDKYFVKAVYGSTVCEYGEWKGKLPVCRDTRCSVQNLDSPGLKPGTKKLYGQNEILVPVCTNGYEIANHLDSNLVCVDGKWQGKQPPCKPARCNAPPPAPTNGRITTYSMDHDSLANYVCDSGYVINASPLKCSYGQWSVPARDSCKNARCFLKDLSPNDGVDISDPRPTLPGKYAEIKCLDRFEMISNKPLCSNDGKWILQGDVSPCHSEKCIVHSIENGQFRYMKISHTTNFWGNVRTTTEFVQETIGLSYNHGSNIYVTCIKPYIFQGKISSAVYKVVCEFGEWSPLPMCLQPGMPMPVKSTLKLSTVAPLSLTTKLDVLPEITVPSTTKNSVNRLKIDLPSPTAAATTVMEAELNITDVDYVEEDKEEDRCSCTYNLDDPNVYGYLGKEQLQFGSKVPQGMTVKFTCKIIGTQRLVGASELVCENCKWHSTQFPSCVEPTKGDPIMYILSQNQIPVRVNPDGIAIVPSGISFNISCRIKDSVEWAVFMSSMDLPVHYREEFIDGKYIYWSDVVVSLSSSKYSGQYTCISNARQSTFLRIAIIDVQCPEVTLTDNSLTVSYSSNSRKVNSKAHFECSNKSMVLDGSHDIYCLSSGLWSHDLPTCQYVTCPEIVASENLNITYSDGQHVDSLAEFHCLKPFVVREAKSSVCLPGGFWSEDVPVCQYVSCRVSSLKQKLPEDVVPRKKEVLAEEEVDLPYGTVLRLECTEEDLRPLGIPSANCSEDGDWIIGDVICTPGCNAVEKFENELIIDPSKEFYRFGEHVTFACPPGLELNLDIERIMCFREGWSEKTIPQCVPIPL